VNWPKSIAKPFLSQKALNSTHCIKDSPRLPDQALLDLAVDGMPLQVRVVFLLLHAFCLQLLVAAGHVAGYRFAFRTGFRAFDCDVLPWHDRRYIFGLEKSVSS
jgi:hypothetical protein